MSSTERLDQIEARAAAASSGPWDYDDTTIYSGDWDASVATYDLDSRGTADVEFIAHARTDVPALVTTLRAVLAACDDVDTETDEAQQGWLVDAIHAAIEGALR